MCVLSVCVCVCLLECVLCEVVLLIKLAIVLIKLVMHVLSGLTPYVCIECVCVYCFV